MSNTWQSWAVLTLVVLAAAYSVWYWLPARFRKLLGVVHQALAQKPSCGSCSSCGKCAAPPPGTHAATASAQPIMFHRKR
jgi:hypothetical protein